MVNKPRAVKNTGLFDPMELSLCCISNVFSASPKNFFFKE